MTFKLIDLSHRITDYEEITGYTADELSEINRPTSGTPVDSAAVPSSNPFYEPTVRFSHKR